MIGGERRSLSASIRFSARLRPARARSPQRRAARDAIRSRGRGTSTPGRTAPGISWKMIHNGIEYGLMQAYAEGFDILKHAGDDSLPAEHRLDLNLADIAETWRRGSVITSWLLDLTAAALAEEGDLHSYTGNVA